MSCMLLYMQILKVINSTYTLGKEQVNSCQYLRGDLKLIVDTVSIDHVKTVVEKSLYKQNDLLKTLLVYFDKTGKLLGKIPLNK